MPTLFARIVGGTALAVSLIVGSPLARAQQDNCQDAGLSIFGVGNLTNATIDGSCSCQINPQPDIWWSYRPATSGVLELGACGLNGSNYCNPLLSVHTGIPGTSANEIACNDDAPVPNCNSAGSSHLFVPVNAGQTYLIRASTSDGLPGVMTVYAFSGPAQMHSPNDTWQTASAVAPGLIHGNDLHATSQGYAEAWYSYTPASTGAAFAETCGLMGDDTWMDLRQGSTMLQSSDDACGLQSHVGWLAQAGVEYQIGVRFFFGEESTFTFRLSGPPAAHDASATAPTIGDGVRWLSFEGAGAEGASPCDTGSQPDVFYRYVVPATGVLSVSTLGSDDGQFPDAGEDTLLSLHSGSPATSANTIACNDTAPANGLDAGALADASVRSLVVAGQVVLIRVTRVGPDQHGSNFPVRLEVSFAPADFTLCAGDGTGTACPCANSGASGHGCANSQDASGALLVATGQASVANDTLALHGTNMPTTGTALYVQGTTASVNGAGLVLGDGLRCVSGIVRRLGVRLNAGGASSFGFNDGVHLSLAGLIPPGGGSRVYQIWHRDAAPYCTSLAFNFSNGLSIAWGP